MTIARRALAEVRSGGAALESGKGQVNGTLRVSMPVLFGHLCVAPIMLELAHEHPGLTLKMSSSDRMTDLGRRPGPGHPRRQSGG
ncbi:hypothetical protein [Achromobacter sp.]|uniref:hypothetical protein n=1 Tax=Achromobacter sp. TaxID=134375 RepID=UPI002F92E8D7